MKKDGKITDGRDEERSGYLLRSPADASTAPSVDGRSGESFLAGDGPLRSKEREEAAAAMYLTAESSGGYGPREEGERAKELLEVRRAALRDRLSEMRRKRDEDELRRVGAARDHAREDRDGRRMRLEDDLARALSSRMRGLHRPGLDNDSGGPGSGSGGRNRCLRQQQQETGAVYFGDALESSPVAAATTKEVIVGGRGASAWIPHGRGRYCMAAAIATSDGDKEEKAPIVTYEGGFCRGRMHGDGSYRFVHDDNDVRIWDGQFRMDSLHGIGRYRSERPGRVSGDSCCCSQDRPEGLPLGETMRYAIYNRNRRVCFTDEMCPGTHIAFQNTQRGSSGAIVLCRCRSEGKFLVKTDEGAVLKVDLTNGDFSLTSKVKTVSLHSVLSIDEKGKDFMTKRTHRLRASLITDHGENLFFEEPVDAREKRDLAMLEKRREDASAFGAYTKKLEVDRVGMLIEEELRKERAHRVAAELVVIREYKEHQENLKRQKEALALKRRMEKAKIDKSREPTFLRVQEEALAERRRKEKAKIDKSRKACHFQYER